MLRGFAERLCTWETAQTAALVGVCASPHALQPQCKRPADSSRLLVRVCAEYLESCMSGAHIFFFFRRGQKSRCYSRIVFPVQVLYIYINTQFFSLLQYLCIKPSHLFEVSHCMTAWSCLCSNHWIQDFPFSFGATFLSHWSFLVLSCKSECVFSRNAVPKRPAQQH